MICGRVKLNMDLEADNAKFVFSRKTYTINNTQSKVSTSYVVDILSVC
jgi:hypothetical protein